MRGNTAELRIESKRAAGLSGGRQGERSGEACLAMRLPVAIDPPENGTLFADRGYAGPGETVTLYVFPNDGYRLVSLGYLTLLAKFVKARGEGVIIH